jgi:hypothetical protein
MLSRIELTEGSIKTRSDSFRDTTSGWSKASMVFLIIQYGREDRQEAAGPGYSLRFYLGLVVTLDHL